MKIRFIFIIVLSFNLSACAFSEDKEVREEGLNADQLYQQARAAMDSGYFDEAIDYYQQLEIAYPFSVYAQQALLDSAYAYYNTEELDLTVIACDRFIKLYPKNRHVDYAYYLKGLAYFNRNKDLLRRYIPTDESKRDVRIALNAFQVFRELVERYPKSRYVADTKQRMIYLRNTLARHEIHVAHYYMRRNAFVAAANRASYVIENYQRTDSVADALVILAKAYRILGMDDLSADVLRVLELNHPNHPGIYQVKATRLL